MTFSDRIVLYVRNHFEWVVLVLLLMGVGAYGAAVFAPKVAQTRSASELDVVVRQINVKGQKFWPLRRKMQTINYVAMVQSLKKFSFYEEFLTRDVFHPYQKDVEVSDVVINPYQLLEVIRHEVPFIWKGIFAKEGDVVEYAQFNSKKGTAFLRKDDKIMGYVVEAITPYYVDVRHMESGSLLRLDKDKVALEEGIQAKIYNKENGKTALVREGDFTEGWDIRSITSESVTLHKGGVSVVAKKGDSQE